MNLSFRKTDDSGLSPLLFYTAGMSALLLFFNRRADDKARQCKDAVPAPREIRDDFCTFCGGQYIVGTVINCPHCGAAIPERNKAKQEHRQPQA